MYIGIVIAGKAMQSLRSALSPMPICNDRFSTKLCKKGACSGEAGAPRKKVKGERIKVMKRKKAKGQRAGLLKPLSFDL